MNETTGPERPVDVELPPDEPPRPVRPVRDVWDKVQILIQPLGGLFTAFAIVSVGLWAYFWLRPQREEPEDEEVFAGTTGPNL